MVTFFRWIARPERGKGASVRLENSRNNTKYYIARFIDRDLVSLYLYDRTKFKDDKLKLVRR